MGSPARVCSNYLGSSSYKSHCIPECSISIYQYINNLYSEESCNGVARGDERSRDDDRCFLGSSKIGLNSCIVCFYWHSHVFSWGSEIYIVSLLIVVLHVLLLGFLKRHSSDCGR